MHDPTVDRANLVSIVTSPGYEVVMRFFEEACKNLETDHMNTDSAKPEAVMASFREAKGGWKIFNEVKARIARELNAAQGEKVRVLDLEALTELHLKGLGPP
jgi:hypothetical protein